MGKELLPFWGGALLFFSDQGSVIRDQGAFDCFFIARSYELGAWSSDSDSWHVATHVSDGYPPKLLASRGAGLPAPSSELKAMKKQVNAS